MSKNEKTYLETIEYLDSIGNNGPEYLGELLADCKSIDQTTRNEAKCRLRKLPNGEKIIALECL